MEPCKFFARPADWDNTGSKFPFKLNLLQCSGCKYLHPARAFSRQERNKEDRQCIGREAGVRLCEHETIYQREIERWIASLMRDPHSSGTNNKAFQPFQDTIKYCDHSSHDPVREQEAPRSQSQYQCASGNPNVPDFRPQIALHLPTPGKLKLSLKWTTPHYLGDSQEKHIADDRRARFGPHSTPHQAHLCGDGSPCVYLDAPSYVHTKFVLLGEYGPAGTDPQACRYNPSHEWFHAVDTHSYTNCDKGARDGVIDPEKVYWPSYRNPTCTYYYHGYQTYCLNFARSLVRVAWDELHYTVPETLETLPISGGKVG